jgi:hypothetical protein
MKVLGVGAILGDDIGDKSVTVPEERGMGARNIGGAVFNVVVHLRRLGLQHVSWDEIRIDKRQLGEINARTSPFAAISTAETYSTTRSAAQTSSR